MNKFCITVRGIAVQGANLNTCGFAVGGAPLTAAWGFATAMLLPLGIAPKSFALAVHERDLPGMWDGWRFEPAQRRGAGVTYERTTRGMCTSSDYLTGGGQLSTQPIIEASMRVSIVAVVETDLDVQDVQACVQNLLPDLRFAGGTITNSPEVIISGSYEKAVEDIGAAWWVMDRRDLLEKSKDLLGDFCHNLGRGDLPWMSAACCGWATISDFAQRPGSREGFMHAWVEPLIGLVQYVQPDNLPENREAVMWQAAWHGKDAFVFTQLSSQSSL